VSRTYGEYTIDDGPRALPCEQGLAALHG
jgi:hypothetical protein